MSTSITKQGILLADGVEVGENILSDSVIDEISASIPSSSYTNLYSKKTASIPTEETYTLSFMAKSDTENAILHTYFYSPNTTTTCVSSQGTTKTAADGNMMYTLTTEWKKYWVTYSQTETTATKTVVFRATSKASASTQVESGTIYVKQAKLEAGTTVTPWTPAPTDDIYVGDHGFFEGSDKGSIGKGYMEGNEFYEI